MKISFNLTGQVRISRGISPHIPENFIKKAYPLLKNEGGSQVIQKKNIIFSWNKELLLKKFINGNVGGFFPNFNFISVGDGLCDYDAQGIPIGLPEEYAVESLDNSAIREVFSLEIYSRMPAIKIDDSKIEKRVFAIASSYSLDIAPEAWKANNTERLVNQMALVDENGLVFAKSNFFPIGLDKEKDETLTFEWIFTIGE